MKQVTTKTGLTGTLTIDSKQQTATLTTTKGTHLIAFMRNNKIVIKSDLHLNNVDLTAVKTVMSQFIKKQEEGNKKRK